MMVYEWDDDHQDHPAPGGRLRTSVGGPILMCPSAFAQGGWWPIGHLVYFTWLARVYGEFNYSIHGVYKPYV